MKYVLDASAGLYLASSGRGFAGLAGHDLHAPALFWSECTSAIRQKLWRGEISRQLADRSMAALMEAAVERHHERELYVRASQIAERAGWAKTYDAEYVALAELLSSPLITRDERLRRGAGRIVSVVTPAAI